MLVGRISLADAILFGFKRKGKASKGKARTVSIADAILFGFKPSQNVLPSDGVWVSIADAILFGFKRFKIILSARIWYPFQSLMRFCLGSSTGVPVKAGELPGLFQSLMRFCLGSSSATAGRRPRSPPGFNR